MSGHQLAKSAEDPPPGEAGSGAGVAIVIPTYEERDTISQLLRRLHELLPLATLVVVDDAGSDDTAAVVESLSESIPSIKLLGQPDKGGLGRAYRIGFAWALHRGFGVILQLDADLSHDPQVAPNLVRTLYNDGADMVIGSRYIPGGSIPDWAWWRRLLSKWGNRYASRLLRVRVTDCTSGFRGWRSDLLSRIDVGSTRSLGYAFQIEMAYRAAAAGGHVAEVPIRFLDRRDGRSKMSRWIILEAFARVTWWGLRDRLSGLVRADTQPDPASSVPDRT